jgi:hypothetical protein
MQTTRHAAAKISVDNDFPILPENVGRWVPVYVEPQTNSGERLIVGVMSWTANGHAEVRLAVDVKSAAKSVLGPRYSLLMQLAENLLTDLLLHFNRENSIDGWKSPYHDFYLGTVKTTIGHDALDIADRMLDSNSILRAGHCAVAPEDHLAEKFDPIRWVNGVRTRALSRSPSYAKYFDQEHRIHARARPMKVDFIGAHAACYFSWLTPGNGLSNTVMSAKAKLFSLQELRDSVFAPSNELAFKWRELKCALFLAIPDTPQDGRSTVENMREAISELEYAAQAQGLHVLTPGNDIDAADQLLRLEAA